MIHFMYCLTDVTRKDISALHQDSSPSSSRVQMREEAAVSSGNFGGPILVGTGEKIEYRMKEKYSKSAGIGFFYMSQSSLPILKCDELR